uniref:Leucine-rich repeat-containing N-terminal plant-type domain-containing protein n=1 Tax=Grammatophora oceanica TaxID=210454 RepID=A0A7S1YAM6_9STRA|mmetsp:Transcript_36600/g.54567  ORF Transcript_36600/g.54567 Transcript_36600/m.54567 type:complete len:1104 (+) Transcript_36600:367-3678(+)|eukprot:CAMPEP_0194046026 /NCGR_PEP_ID=MMETSP0009_2-20130614/19127_1 /TAXON_ID=210454 /ORGANISM="Grammatophora oceanica, Strain CCMP 410" /LENGTH=1103 /DNA_ID=CAMNT_0038691131 /DNA_START=367 /DNA_END=3678 /DNA_ORIENTATION=+
MDNQNNKNNNDAKNKAEKNKARRIYRASKPGVESVGATEAARLDARIAEKRGNNESAATTPGAVPMSKERAARLDQRIAEKQAQGSLHAGSETPSTKPSRRKSSKPERKSSSSSARTQLNQLESDVQAKTRSISGVRSSGAPGAVSVGAQSQLSQLERDVEAKTRSSGTTSGSSSARTQLNQLEADMQAKTRARGSKKKSSQQQGSPSTRSQLNQLEADVHSKTRARRSAGASQVGAVPVAADHSSARTQLNQLESDVHAKTRASSSSTGTAPGARSQLNQLEADVHAKTRARRSTGSGAVGAVPVSADRSSARTQLNQLESDVHAKTRASSGSTPATVPGARTQLNQLEADVHAKTRASSGPSTHARASLDQLEDDLFAKNRARGPAPAATPGATTARTQLNQLEDDVTSKSRIRRSGSTQPGARAELDELEGAVMAKTGNRQQNEIDRLDQRIRSKVSGTTRTGSTVSQPEVNEQPRSVVRELQPEDDAMFMDEYDQHKKDDTNEVDLGDGNALITMQQRSDADIKAENFGHGSMTHLSGIPQDDKPMDPPGNGGENQAPTLAAARGMLNEPDVEYGTASPGGTDNRGGIDGGLAVAVAIQAEEDEAFIPAAVQYDPDSKPPIYRNRRFRMWAMVSVLLLGVIVGATILGVKKSAEDGGPTAPPSTIREGLYDFKSPLSAIVGESAFEDPDSPHSVALDWITNIDSMSVIPSDPNFVQRFLLAVFYLSTTEFQPWASCNRPDVGMGPECIYLKPTEFFPEVKVVQIEWIRWMSDAHECAWAGIFCDEFNQTRAIELVGQEIRGEFPYDLIHLPYLQSIALTWNELYGTLPSEVAEMKHLLNVELHYNFFSGLIPAEWYSAQALQRLNIGGNRLSGTIPTEIGQLSTMKGFFCFENDIKGTIPTEIGNMKFLSFTRFNTNVLGGTLPTEIGKLAKLRELWTMRNQMNGTVPTEVVNMRDLTDMRLHSQNLTGSFPTQLFYMPQLERFDSYDTLMTGSIPTEIGVSSKLQSFRIRNSFITGTIPTEMGAAKSLKELWLHKTLLTGSIPVELCSLRGTRGLTILTADCKEEQPGIEPVIKDPLQCATACCERVERTCNNPAYTN